MKTNVSNPLAAVMRRARRVLEFRHAGVAWLDALRASHLPAIAGGAYAIVNETFATWGAAWLPAAHSELADQTLVAGTLTTTTVNTGVAGLRWARLKGRIKTLGSFSAGETFRISLRTGTGAALTAPVNIAQTVITMETGDETFNFQLLGWSEGFQSWNVIMTCSDGAAVSVVDLMFDAA